MLPRATSKSTPRSTSSFLYDFSRPCTWIAGAELRLSSDCPFSFRVFSGGAIDGAGQPVPLPLVHPLPFG